MFMNDEELQTKIADVEKNFNEKKEARERALSEASSLLEEMLKLQGAHQLLIEMTSAEDKVAVKEEGKK